MKNLLWDREKGSETVRAERSEYRGFINNLITLNLSKSIFHIRISTSIRNVQVHKSLFKIALWRKTDNVTYYFIISSKTLKAVCLSIHWFNDSWTRGFELVTRKFELVTCEFELVTCRFELITRRFELVTRRFELVTRGFELVTRRFKLVIRGFELLLLDFNSCF